MHMSLSCLAVSYAHVCGVAAGFIAYRLPIGMYVVLHSDVRGVVGSGGLGLQLDNTTYN